MKNILILITAMFFVFCCAANAGVKQFSPKEARDAYYLNLEKNFGFTASDCGAVRKAGFSPYFAFVLLNIAAETKQPVTTMIKMRNEGDTWADMCKAYSVDYSAFMDRLDKLVIDRSMVFPDPISQESKKDVSSGPKKRGSKK
jgi:hypothetical protein